MSTVYSQRVLSIPELLNLVFSFLDPKSNTANARVSKSWSDIALSVLWCEVHDLWTLVRLLGPLKGGRGRSYVRRFNAIVMVFTYSYRIHRNYALRSNPLTGSASPAMHP
jgi:hypothetical protein